LNVSNRTGDFPSNPRLAYHFGGFINIQLSEKFSLHPELLYLSIGSTFESNLQNFSSQDPFNPSFNSSLKFVDRVNFLAIPVNFRYSFTSKFGLDFGPQVSFLLNTFSKIKETPGNIDVTSRRVSGKFKPDYGANLGLTFSLNEKMNIQLRYYQGLKNLNRNSIIPDDKSYNIALQASVGYTLF
jgi:hypothetical protein